MRFLGREQELSALEREYKRDGGFVVVYGRRRVGKTTLIKEFIKGKNALYFLANEESDRQNLNKFTEKVADFTQQPHLAGSRLESWQSAFRMLAAYQPQENKVLVIDEFQYLVSVNAAYPSIFQEAWDEILKDSNVMAILCGLLISMMISKVLSRSSPLYGRRTAQIRLQPLRFAGECKNYDKPVPADVYFDLKKKCEGVTEFQGKHIVYGIFSKSGFEQRLLDTTKENPDLYLFDQGERIL